MSTPTRPTGRRETRGGHDLVVYTRTFAAPLDDVWAAVTEPRRLERWVGTWEGDRNKRGCRIHWTFTIAAARLKLKKLYPSIEG